MNFFQVGQEREDGLVTERNENDTVVTQRGESGVHSHFLSSTRCTGGNEDAGVFSSEGTFSPETTGGIPEGLPWIFESAFVILSSRRGDYDMSITFH